MDVDATLDRSRLQARVATQEEWQAVGAWIEAVADESVPLRLIWHLVHLVTYGWADNLKTLERELRRALGRDDLPANVHGVLWQLAQLVSKRSGKDEPLFVARVGEN
jgi:hypothetical protein